MNKMKTQKKWFFILMLILAVGFCLRMYNLDKYSFWFDEILTIWSARINFTELMQFSISLVDPPVFSVFLHFWRFLGESEFKLRLLSSMFGMLSIIMVYKVGQLLFDKKTGLISAFILSISPFHIYYSQEVSDYILVNFLALMSIYYFVKSLKRNKLTSWIIFIIVTTLFTYTHNIALFLILAQNFFFFFSYKKNKNLFYKWLISQFFIFLLYLPWFGIIVEQTVRGQTSDIYYWISPVSLEIIVQTFGIFNIGYHATPSLYFLSNLLFIPLFLSGIWNGIQKNIKIYLLLFWLSIPIIIAIIVSRMVIPIYLYRALIYTSPAYYIIVAYGLSKIKRPISYLSLLCVVILASLSLGNYYQNILLLPEFPYHIGVHAKKDNKAAADYIKDNFQKGDIIVHKCLSTFIPFLYYHDRKLEERWAGIAYSEDFMRYKKIYYSFPTQIRTKLLKQSEPTTVRQIIKDHNRIWFVLSAWEVNKLNLVSGEMKEWLDNNCVLLNNKDFIWIRIYLYQIC